MREAGLDDGQILEVNQIICYFNYVNRSINGLGVTTEGDIVGYYAGELREALRSCGPRRGRCPRAPEVFPAR